MLTIQPHKWQERGENYRADYYPFVDGEPAPHLADCAKCSKYRGEETCTEWAGKEGQEPLFCGPICDKFTLG